MMIPTDDLAILSDEWQTEAIDLEIGSGNG
jgi:hypothetical protein